MNAVQAASLAWVVFLAYWWWSARGTAETVSAEAGSSRIVHLILLGLAFALVLWDGWPRGWLRHHLWPFDSLASWLGTGLTWGGVAWAIWARRHLGRYWSGQITLKDDHQLIRTGPYRWSRHPIYTGILLALAGSAVAVGQIHALLGFAVGVLAYVRKIRQEEAMLRRQFGATYDAFAREVKALVPGIW